MMREELNWSEPVCYEFVEYALIPGRFVGYDSYHQLTQ